MSEVRPIDANALRKDFVDRYHKAEDWIAKAKDEEIKTRAEATRDFIGEVIMTIDNAQTLESYKQGYQKGLKVGKKIGSRTERTMITAYLEGKNKEAERADTAPDRYRTEKNRGPVRGSVNNRRSPDK